MPDDSRQTPFSITPEDAGKAEAMALYSDAALRAIKKGKLDDDGFDRLFKALESDPDSDELPKIVVAELKKAGRLNTDADRLFEIARRNPSSLRLAMTVSSMLEELGRSTDAMKALELAVRPIASGSQAKLPQPFPEALSKLCLMYLKAERTDDAVELLDWASETPSLADNPAILQSAIAVYSMAAAKASDSKPLLLRFLPSDKERLTAKLESSMDAFQRAFSEKRADIRLYGLALDVLAKEGRLRQAKSIVLDSLMDNPDDNAALLRLAGLYFDSGDYQNSARVWKRVFKSGGKIPPQFYLAYGLSAQRAGDLKDAINAYEWCLLMQPDDEAATSQLAWALYEAGHYGKALAKIGKMKPRAENLYLKAFCLQRLSKYQEALQALMDCEAAADKDFKARLDDRNSRMIFASFAERAKRPDIIEAKIKPLIDANPDDAEAMNFLGYTWADMDARLPEAESYIRKAVGLEPSNPAMLDSMAWVLYRLGRHKEALEWIKKSLAAAEGLPDAVIADHAGDIYEALGDSKSALKYWRMALSTYSDETDPQKIASKIKAKGADPEKGGDE